MKKIASFIFKLAIFLIIVEIVLRVNADHSAESKTKYIGMPGTEFSEFVACHDPRLIEDLMEYVGDLGDFHTILEVYRYGGHCVIVRGGIATITRPWGNPKLDWNDDPVESWIAIDIAGARCYLIVWPTLLHTMNGLKPS